MQASDFPYTIVALAPFTPLPEGNYTPTTVAVDLSNLDEGMAMLSPVLRVAVSQHLCPDSWLTIAFKQLKDLRPERVCQNNDYLRPLMEGLALIEKSKSEGQDAAVLAKELNELLRGYPLDITAPQQNGGAASPGDDASSAVDDILAMVSAPGGDDSPVLDASGAKANWKAQIEGLVSALLKELFADEGFRTFEAAWRGAQTMLKQARVKEGGAIRVKLTPVDMAHLSETLQALTLELADELPNLVLVDLAFDSKPNRLELLQEVSEFAQTLLAPTMISVAPEFFHIEDWAELTKVSYLGNYLEDAAYAKWRKLRQEPASAWVAATLNGFMFRAAYGEEVAPRGVFFQESDQPWVSAAWGLGALIAKSVQEHGWPSRFTDYHSVLLEDLPVADAGQGPVATQTVLSEDRIMEFMEAGFTPLVGAVRKDIAMAPKETMLTGGALSGQLFINRVLGFFFRGKEVLPGAVSEGDLGRNLEHAFALFWELSGHKAPSDLSITAQAGEGGSAALQIGFTPPGDVLPGAPKIQFSFDW